jgi:hypothetical protein
LCVRRESQGDQIEHCGSWGFAPHHLTEIDSLQRLKQHLDRLAARFRATGLISGFDGESDTLHALDLALVGSSASMIRRFESPGARHDLLADLESDMSDFERLLDERTLLLAREECLRAKAVAACEGDVRRSDRPVPAQAVPARAGRSENHFRSFLKLLKVMRRVERRITEAEGDRPMQEFWNDVKRDYQQEADQVESRIGAETTARARRTMSENAPCSRVF